MNTEEKAKRYDEVVEEARKLYENPNSSSIGKGYLYNVFPELKESEDERIRNEIVDFIYWEIDRGSITNEQREKSNAWLAWLEKQKPIEKPNDSIISKMVDEYASNDEKNNEQFGKPLPCMIRAYRQGINDVLSVLRSDYSNYSNPVITEPKFKVGDWIISNDKKSTYQVVEVKRGIYVIRDNADNHEYHIGIEECEKSGSLWTIQDAKDGDVLVHNGCTFIFKGVFEVVVQALEENLTDDLNPVAFGEPDIDNDYHPATKEQRDLLFAKMREAGYEWDAEKKELKKIEQKPAGWSEEDEKILDSIIIDLQELDDRFGRKNISVSIDWLEHLKGRVLPQPKQEWSEEDEEILKRIIRDKELSKECCEYNLAKGLYIEEIKWLKSLKERIANKQSKG